MTNVFRSIWSKIQVWRYGSVKNVIFNDMLNSTDGDADFKAQVMAAMKPEGW
jgi:hypothetical protein